MLWTCLCDQNIPVYPGSFPENQGDRILHGHPVVYRWLWPTWLSRIYLTRGSRNDEGLWYKDLALREDGRLLFVRRVIRIAIAIVSHHLSQPFFIAQARDSPYCLLYSFMWSGLIAVLWLCGQWLILLSGGKGLESPGSGYLICVFCGSLRRDSGVMAATPGHWSQRVIAALAKPQPQCTFLKGSYSMFFCWFAFLVFDLAFQSFLLFILTACILYVQICKGPPPVVGCILGNLD